MVTGTRIKKLGTADYIYTLTLYDDKGRPVQLKSYNHTGGLDISTTQYSWIGQPLVHVTTQNKVRAGAYTIITITKNTYDALGRLTETVNNVIDNVTGVSSGEKVIVQNSYDDLGQLKTKRLGVNGTTAVETQKYEYNVRGWLLGMNRDYVNNTQSTSKFGFELTYDKPASMNPGNAPLYNGNIATMTWRGNQNGADIRRYDFAYDNTSRLLKADFKALTGTVQSGTFNSQMGDGINPESAYDYNGNILAMTQQGLYGGTSTTIDQLTYTYIPGTNKLQKVTDGQTANLNLGDFYNGNTGDNIDYSYDDNGNLKQDLNKNITDIGYNYLNLPENISVAGKGSIVYSYDGVGNKLTKTVNETGQPQKVTVYLGNLIFENNALQFVNTEEGRARLESGAWKYDYFLRDHLGNTRVVVDEVGTVLQETDYYPFGLPIEKYSTVTNNYLYQGKELQRELGLGQFDFAARFYDPQIGRWHVLDPLSEKARRQSPYNFALNNPIRFIDPDGMEADDWIKRGNRWAYDPNITTRQQAMDAKADDFAKNGTVLNNAKLGDNGEVGNVWLQEGGKASYVPDGFTTISSAEPSSIPNNWLTRAINELYVGGATLMSGPMGYSKTDVKNLWEGSTTTDQRIGAGLTTLSIPLTMGLGSGEAAAAKTVGSGAQYSVAFEMKLASGSYPGVYRGAHFLEANKALSATMATDARFASSMSQLGINIPRSSAGSILGRSPANWVWHHDINAGVMQLVPKSQHTIGSSFWNTLHPGGRGGFSIWGK